MYRGNYQQSLLQVQVLELGVGTFMCTEECEEENMPDRSLIRKKMIG